MKIKVFATFLFSLMVVPLVQSADNSPRLVVGITVDQLRTDYLEALQHLFGEKGFKRLMREGVVCENLVFDFPNIDKASATATLYTGTNTVFLVRYRKAGARIFRKNPRVQAPAFKIKRQ